uniref:Kelch-like protein 20 n=1 Tax=Phallusia mammillata TaxID=59560 RepID=A0A6F9DFC0_9ASCI|nr:kelch-like protein 20 [Phallusia mammillata]
MLVSNYFRRMFTVEMREKYEGIVKIKQISCQRLANLIEFIYSGKITITEENVIEILDDAEYTEIEVLKAKCSAFLLNVVSADNCLKLRAYAQRYNLDELTNKTNQSIVENLNDVVQDEDFTQLDFDDVSFILDKRNKNFEEAAFTGIVKWVNHNPLQREELFVKLFPKLDLSLMSVDFLNSVYEENLVKNNLTCVNLLARAALKVNKKVDAGDEDTRQGWLVCDVSSKPAKQIPSSKPTSPSGVAMQSTLKTLVKNTDAVAKGLAFGSKSKKVTETQSKCSNFSKNPKPIFPSIDKPAENVVSGSQQQTQPKQTSTLHFKASTATSSSLTSSDSIESASTRFSIGQANINPGIASTAVAGRQVGRARRRLKK